MIIKVGNENQINFSLMKVLEFKYHNRLTKFSKNTCTNFFLAKTYSSVYIPGILIYYAGMRK